MKLSEGKPIYEGRYVAYVVGIMGWLQPTLVTWTKGKWHFVHSSAEYPDRIYGWIGPLPAVALKNGVARLSDDEEPEREEQPLDFDL